MYTTRRETSLAQELDHKCLKSMVKDSEYRVNPDWKNSKSEYSDKWPTLGQNFKELYINTLDKYTQNGKCDIWLADSNSS